MLLIVLFRTLNSSRDLLRTAWQKGTGYLSRLKQEYFCSFHSSNFEEIATRRKMLRQTVTKYFKTVLLFYPLPQKKPYTKKEMDLDYFRQKLNV